LATSTRGKMVAGKKARGRPHRRAVPLLRARRPGRWAESAPTSQYAAALGSTSRHLSHRELNRRMADVEIWRCDCLEGLGRLEDESVDYVFTDPPYGIDLRGQRRPVAPIPNDGLRGKDYQGFLRRVLVELRRVMKPNTAAHVCGGWSTADVVARLLKELFTLKGCIVWVKNGPGLGWQLRRQHEFVWLAFKGKPPRPRKAPSDVWHFNRVAPRKALHVAEKPEGLVAAAMGLYSRPGDLVLDPFCGSGTTPVVAHRLRRRCIAMEVDPIVHRVAVRRLAAEAAGRVKRDVWRASVKA